MIFILLLIFMSFIKIATLLVLIALVMGLKYSRVDAASYEGNDSAKYAERELDVV
jgi:hypothetical protein